MNIFFIIYDIIFILGFIAYLPFYTMRKKINFFALKEKLGFIPKIGNDETVWIQAVSVGEVNLIGPFLKRIREIYNYPIVISTTTLTGYRLAKSKYRNDVKIIFFPFDISFVIKRVLKIIKPKIFIAVETEIWPNLFSILEKKGIPRVIINGRISDRAFRRYKMVRFLMKKVVGKCNYIGVQNQEYKDRFIYLGAQKERVIISGNMKFEGVDSRDRNFLSARAKYDSVLKSKGNLILIAASTHYPEEEMVVDIYQDISSVLRNITLIIVPRHPERVVSIEEMIKNKGLNFSRASKVDKQINAGGAIFIVDTLGELLYFYSICDICFVGGSLSNDGGHNILEPINFLKPTIFGPNMNNFKDIEEIVLEKGAGIKVSNSEELKEMFLRLIHDKALRYNFRSKCFGVFQEEKRGLDKNLEIIIKCLN